MVVAARRFGVAAVRPQLTWRLLGLAVLLAAISLSPRMPLPVPVPGKRFDLRAEDIVLVVLAVAWWFRGPRVDFSANRTLWRLIGAYLAIGLLSSVTGILIGGLNPLRAATFWGKQVEFFLIFALVASWATEARDRSWLLAWFLVLGYLNAAWAAVQLFTNHFRPLLLVNPGYDLAVAKTLYESYGPGLIGEVSPLSTGAFFLVEFLVVFALICSHRLVGWLQQVLAAAGLSVFLVFLFLSQSRVSMVGSLLGAVVVAVTMKAVRRGAVNFGIAFLAATASLLLSRSPSLARIIGVSHIQNSLSYRENVTWAPITGPARGISSAHLFVHLPNWLKSAVDFAVGHGVGSMGSIDNLPNEAHDEFLRVFAESGVVGLILFVVLVLAIGLFAFSVHHRSAPGSVDAITSAAALGVLVAFLAASSLQDMFFPVIPNEVLWFLLGLVAATGQSVPLSWPPGPAGLRARPRLEPGAAPNGEESSAASAPMPAPGAPPRSPAASRGKASP